MYHKGRKRFDVFTARKRSLGQGNVFTTVFNSVHRGGCLPYCFYAFIFIAWIVGLTQYPLSVVTIAIVQQEVGHAASQPLVHQ